MKKNIAQKTLSVLLAAVLLLAVVPVAYATPLTEFYIDSDQTDITLAVDQSFGPTFYYSPDMNFAENISVSSSDEAVATADEYGSIYAHSVGTATITYTPIDNPELEATCTVTVTEEGASITLIMLAPVFSDITVGESKDVYYQYEPRYANKDIELSVTEGSEFIEIEETVLGFNVTGVAPGNVKITVTDNNSDKECILSFAVIPPVAVTGIKFSDNSFRCYVGDYPYFPLDFAPVNATNTLVTFSSSDSSIVDVASEYGIVAKKEGTCVITVTTDDGGFTDELTVIVTTRPEMTDIELPSEELTVVEGHESYIFAEAYPEGALYSGDYLFSSSDESVVEVDEYGGIRAISVGTATITVTTDDGSFSKTCEVTVTSPVYPRSITSEYTELLLKVGQSYDVFLEYRPTNTTEFDTNSTSSNPEVAEVYDSFFGISIYAEAVGEAVITIASDTDPSVTTQINVTVTETGTHFDDFSAPTEGLTVFLNPRFKGFYIPIYFFPEYASNTKVEWVSGDDTIASYSNSEYYGNSVYSNFVAKRTGTVTLTATLEDGTEIDVEVIITDEERQYIELIDGSDYTIDNSGYLRDVEANTSLADLTQQFDSVGIIKVVDCNGNEITDENACVGTGAIISLISEETGATHDRINVVVNGDINGDAKITTDDARMVLRSTVNLEELYAERYFAAKVSSGENGDISTDDARKILRYTVGLETEL